MKVYRYTVLLLYCVALCFASLYVPWRVDLKGFHQSLGYSWLWRPDYMLQVHVFDTYPSTVDFPRACLGLIVVTAAAGIALLLGELGRQVWPSLAPLRRYLNKTTFVAAAILLVTVLGWVTYSKWQENIRMQQRAACEAIGDRWRASQKKEADSRRAHGGMVTMGDLFLADSGRLGEEYQACLAQLGGEGKTSQ